MDINKLFNNYLDITTKDGKSFHIEKKDVLIHAETPITGIANVYQRKNNVYVITEVYSLEDNRLRYSYIKFEDAKAYNTIEKQNNGKESSVYVIENYSNVTQNVGSIGNIIKLESDKTEKINKKSKDKMLILRLLQKRKNNEVEDEDITLSA